MSKIKLVEVNPFPFNVYAVHKDGKDTGCTLAMSDMHGVHFALFFPCGDSIRLKPNVELVKRHMESDWKSLEDAAKEETGLTRKELYIKAEEYA